VTSINSARATAEQNNENKQHKPATGVNDNLVSFLHSLLATAIVTQQTAHEAHIREALRYVQLFDQRGWEIIGHA
jgi:hypothetical protein